MLGYASAVSVLLFLAILVLTLVQRFLLKETARG
jgi:ABC-type sugar transport system permease subunit